MQQRDCSIKKYLRSYWEGLRIVLHYYRKNQKLAPNHIKFIKAERDLRMCMILMRMGNSEKNMSYMLAVEGERRYHLKEMEGS